AGSNREHGGPGAGGIFAAATVLTFVLWLLKLRDRYRAARRAAGLLDAPTAKFRLIRWVVMPRLTGRAWLVAVEYNLRDADEALRRARLWRDTYTDTHHATTGTWSAQRRTPRAAGGAAPPPPPGPPQRPAPRAPPPRARRTRAPPSATPPPLPSVKPTPTAAVAPAVTRVTEPATPATTADHEEASAEPAV